MTPNNCYCGSSEPFESCCNLYINGAQKAPTALALMKSRYSAYATHQADYLLETTHSSQRNTVFEIRDFALGNSQSMAKTGNHFGYRKYCGV